jgi:hypothetical protein
MDASLVSKQDQETLLSIAPQYMYIYHIITVCYKGGNNSLLQGSVLIALHWN